jgi:hypothetical protein
MNRDDYLLFQAGMAQAQLLTLALNRLAAAMERAADAQEVLALYREKPTGIKPAPVSEEAPK